MPQFLTSVVDDLKPLNNANPVYIYISASYEKDSIILVHVAKAAELLGQSKLFGRIYTCSI